MGNNKFNIAELFFLVLGVGVTIYSLLTSAAWSVDGAALLFTAWTISPFVIFYFAGRLFRKFIRASQLSLISAIIALLMLVFTAVTYYGSMNSGSSTEALVYIFVPVYLYIGSLFLLILGAVFAWLTSRNKNV